MARKGLPVHSDQAKRRRVAERPLVVVEERPVQIAAHLDALRQAREHLAHRCVDVGGPLLVVGGRDPILGDEDRHPWTGAVRPPDGAAERLGVVLVAHLRRLVGLGQLARDVAPVIPRASRSLGPVAKSRVRLDADELVFAGQLEEPVIDSGLELQRARARLGSVLILNVGQGERHAGRDAGPGADRGGAQPVRFEEVVDRSLRALSVVGVAGRVDPEQPAARAQALRFVERAGVRDPVAERLRRPVAVALEKGRKTLRGDAALVVQPLRDGEVMERDDRGHAVLVAGVEHAPVVGQLGA